LLPFEPFAWVRRSLSTLGLTTSSSQLLRAFFLLSSCTRFLISGFIEVRSVVLVSALERLRWRSIGSNKALPRRNMGAKLEASVEAKSGTKEAKFRGSGDGAGA
jgi:hypothetical protein